MQSLIISRVNVLKVRHTHIRSLRADLTPGLWLWLPRNRKFARGCAKIRRWSDFYAIVRQSSDDCPGEFSTDWARNRRGSFKYVQRNFSVIQFSNVRRLRVKHELRVYLGEFRLTVRSRRCRDLAAVGGSRRVEFRPWARLN